MVVYFVFRELNTTVILRGASVHIGDQYLLRSLSVSTGLAMFAYDVFRDLNTPVFW